MSSLFPWMGGKSRLAKRIVAELPDHRCYVELFAGAANVLFVKPPSKTEVINDINDDITNLFRVVRFHRRELLRELLFVSHSRRTWNLYRAQPGLTDIQRAARTWFILKTAFGGRGGTKSPAYGYGTTNRAHFNRAAMKAIRRCHKRLDGVYVECLDFEKCIGKYDRKHTVFYCDPPYLQTAAYKYDFGIADHQRLADRLLKIKGKFLLSINDHEDIRTLYKDCNVKEISVRYSVSRTKTPQATRRTELLIANYPLQKGSGL